MKIKRSLATTLISILTLFISGIVNAEVVDNGNGSLTITWTTNQDWEATVSLDSYLGTSVPIINLESPTSPEIVDDTETRNNCFYTGTLSGVSSYNKVYVNTCSASATYYSGFLFYNGQLYSLVDDVMEVLPVGNTGGTSDDTGSGDNGKRTKGDTNINPDLYDGRRAPDYDSSANTNPGLYELFPSLEVVIEKSYIDAVGDKDSAIDRVVENLALANMMYERVGIKRINLIAITVLENDDITTSDSQGNILGALEKLREQNIQVNSSDVTMFLTGKEFSQPYLWGWSEGGFSCDLRKAVIEGDNLNTHKIGKSAGVIRDLPSLMQRGWILGHEVGHALGAGHWTNDPLMDGGFQPDVPLDQYNKLGCTAKRFMYETCEYDPKNKKFTDFYECP